MCLGAGQRRGVDPLLALAVIDRETLGGTSRYLDARGPAGTGDRNPRRWSRYRDRPEAEQVLRRFENEGVVMCLPADGRGFGRGLMQHDLMGDGSAFEGVTQTAWCLQKLPDGRFAWEDPVLNIDRGCLILATCIEAFDGDEELGACAYNAGIKRVREKLLVLPGSASTEDRREAANALTTDGDYGRDVLALRRLFRDAMNTEPPDPEEITKS